MAAVRVHDFVDPGPGRAPPYGVYDLAQNTGWVSVGVDNDTASFAVETIRRWWHAAGTETYPKATRLLITADGGGSNGSRLRIWKLELQRQARPAPASGTDRTPPVLIHQQELAWPTAHQLQSDREFDCRHYRAQGPEGARRA